MWWGSKTHKARVQSSPRQQSCRKDQDPSDYTPEPWHRGPQGKTPQPTVSHSHQLRTGPGTQESGGSHSTTDCAAGQGTGARGSRWGALTPSLPQPKMMQCPQHWLTERIPQGRESCAKKHKVTEVETHIPTQESGMGHPAVAAQLGANAQGGLRRALPGPGEEPGQAPAKAEGARGQEALCKNPTGLVQSLG